MFPSLVSITGISASYSSLIARYCFIIWHFTISTKTAQFLQVIWRILNKNVILTDPINVLLSWDLFTWIATPCSNDTSIMTYWIIIYENETLTIVMQLRTDNVVNNKPQLCDSSTNNHQVPPTITKFIFLFLVTPSQIDVQSLTTQCISKSFDNHNFAIVILDISVNGYCLNVHLT